MFRAAEVPPIIDNIAIVGREKSGDAQINTDNFTPEQERFSLTFDREADELLVDLTFDQACFYVAFDGAVPSYLELADTI